MKINRTPSLLVAAMCLALGGLSNSLLAQGTTNVISSFNTDLSANPFNTNFWGSIDGGTIPGGSSGVSSNHPSSMSWTNAGNPGGALDLTFDWNQATGPYAWQDNKVQVDLYADPSAYIDMSLYDSIEFDAMVKTNVSQTSFTGDYGGIAVIVQTWDGWGNNPADLDQGYHTLGSVTLPTTNGWAHYKISTTAWPWTLGRLTLQCFNFDNTNNPTHTEVLIDNVEFTAVGKPPVMAIQRAIRGLNFWGTGGGADRNSIETYQDNESYYYMWAGSGASTYSFTLTNWPTGAAQTASLFRMDLIPSYATEGAPDWNEASCIMMEIGVDVNGSATWTFRWKTNAPGSNGGIAVAGDIGTYYDAGDQIQITNPTPLGKWTLSFASDTAVTMTAPNGNSTNFTLGGPYIPDISPAFYEGSTNRGVVYLGIFGGNSNSIDQKFVLASVQFSGNITAVSNNWMSDTTLTNPISASAWVPVAGVQYYPVPTNNALWVEWSLPDGGFALQTNTVNPGSAVSWSTNTGLPPGTLFATHKGVLVKPGDLPNSTKLYYRMSRPGF